MNASAARVTETGGRDATTRHIPPKLALSVGMPSTPAPSGWRWAKLTDLARLESGHTPSRRHPEWWGGEIPWVSIQDARANDGGWIHDTEETTNAVGIENSSARVLPTNTVCLSRTASVGYVVVMGRPMATSQDFVNWVCSAQIDPEFLKYLLIAEGDDLLRFASGSVHQTIYFPEVKAFHVCYPSPIEQRRIVGVLDTVFADISAVKANTERNLQNARAVFENYLQFVFMQRGPAWSRSQLDALTDPDSPITYGVVKPGDEGEIWFVRGGDLDRGRVRLDQLRTITRRVSQQYRRTLLRGGELLICLVGQPGQVAVAPIELAGANIARQVGLVRLGRNISAEFVRYFLQSAAGQEALGARQSGSVQQVINLGALRHLTVHYPSLSQQGDIVAKLDSMEAEVLRLVASYDRKLVALDELEKSILHQAFSGQL